MALSDEQKLDAVRRAVSEWAYSFVDWASFKAALQNVTKVGIKNYILNHIQGDAANDLAASTSKMELHVEVTNDI